MFRLCLRIRYDTFLRPHTNGFYSLRVYSSLHKKFTEVFGFNFG